MGMEQNYHAFRMIVIGEACIHAHWSSSQLQQLHGPLQQLLSISFPLEKLKLSSPRMLSACRSRNALLPHVKSGHWGGGLFLLPLLWHKRTKCVMEKNCPPRFARRKRAQVPVSACVRVCFIHVHFTVKALSLNVSPYNASIPFRRAHFIVLMHTIKMPRLLITCNCRQYMWYTVPSIDYNELNAILQGKLYDQPEGPRVQMSCCRLLTPQSFLYWNIAGTRDFPDQSLCSCSLKTSNRTVPIACSRAV